MDQSKIEVAQINLFIAEFAHCLYLVKSFSGQNLHCFFVNYFIQKKQTSHIFINWAIPKKKKHFSIH